MSFIRHKQRAVTAISPHQGNRRFIVPNHGAPTLPPELGLVYSAALTPGELTGTFTRTGYDNRTGGDGPIGSFSQQPGDFDNQTVQYLFYHWENDTFYFGTDTSEQFGFTQDPVQVAIQGLGFNVTMTWVSTSTGFWQLRGEQANLIGKYLRTRIGVKLAVLIGQ